MQPNDRIRLQHMLDAAEQARAFIRDKCRDDLENDLKLVWALVKAIEIIGEAAYQVRSETKAQLPQIPWEKITGMRHRLVHAYFDIDLDILWKTVQDGLPPLISVLKAALGENT
ncbi:MAG: HepT-like ribonuclease domain-containing protein [Candidatus Methanomethylicaceae archaeon]